MKYSNWCIFHKLYDSDGRKISQWSESAFHVHKRDSVLGILNESKNNLWHEKVCFSEHRCNYFLLSSNGMNKITDDKLEENFNDFIGRYQDEKMVCFLTEIVSRKESTDVEQCVSIC